MPILRRPIHRNTKGIRLLNIIVDLAQCGGKTIEELADEYSMSNRTARRDLQAIEEAGIDLECRDGRYRIPIHSPYLPALQMTHDEAFLFSFCMSMLRREALPREREALDMLRKKVEVLMPVKLADLADRIASLYFPMNRPVSTLDHDLASLRDLEDAITSRVWVRFKYRKRDSESPSGYTVFPHALLTCYGRIYLLGHKEANLDERPILFSVSRISEVEILDPEDDHEDRGLSFPTRVHPEAVIERCFGVWQEDPIDIEVVFFGDAVETVQNTLFHPSQQVQIESDGSARLTLHCGGYKEVLWWVLGFGENAEVIRPEEMRKEIRETLRAALGRYRY